MWSNLSLDVLVLGGGVFGRQFAHQGRALVKGISIPIKETQESSLALYAM